LVFAPKIVIVHTNKTFEKNTGGYTVYTPYISYKEFQNISIDGRGRMETLLTVRSIEQAIRILGNPKEIDTTEINS